MSRQFEYKGCKSIEFNSLLDHSLFIAKYKDDTSLRNVMDVSQGGEGSFRGCSSYEELIDKMVNGDNEATATLLELTSESKSFDVDTTSYMMDIEGCAYDMGSVVSGEPECCLNLGAPNSKPSIKIFVDQGYMGTVDKDVIHYRSCGVVDLVSTLQAKGWIIELVVGNYEAESESYGFTKLNTDTLCISEIAVATSPYYWRVGSWLTTEVITNHHEYGRSAMSREQIDSLENDGWFYIGGGYTDSKMRGLSSPQEASEYIAELFNNYCNKKDVAK